MNSKVAFFKTSKQKMVFFAFFSPKDTSGNWRDSPFSSSSFDHFIAQSVELMSFILKVSVFSQFLENIEK